MFNVWFNDDTVLDYNNRNNIIVVGHLLLTIRNSLNS